MEYKIYTEAKLRFAKVATQEKIRTKFQNFTHKNTQKNPGSPWISVLEKLYGEIL